MFELSESRKVVLGITGSIAAYKSAELARSLVSWGYEVKVIMTEAATKFITPLTLRTITNFPVTTSFWDGSEDKGIGHIELADWANALVVAPASANFLSKLALGFSDSPLLAVALATKAPLLVAPAMNTNMFENPATQEHISLLRKRGVHFVDPEEGELACGWNGSGRMADPWEIFYNVRRVVSRHDYRGKRVLITTGPTREAIDPVRFISNRSSGKMGVALAREAFRRGADVTLIHGPVKVRVPKEVRCVEIETAAQMREAVLRESFDAPLPQDAIIMAAAVADYKPADPAGQKIKKAEAGKAPNLQLEANPDILLELGKRREGSDAPRLVGFAVETGELDALLLEARRKLEAKNADMIVGNFANDAFDLDTNRVWLVDKNGKQEEIATTYKSRVANKILDRVLKL